MRFSLPTLLLLSTSTLTYASPLPITSPDDLPISSSDEHSPANSILHAESYVSNFVRSALPRLNTLRISESGVVLFTAANLPSLGDRDVVKRTDQGLLESMKRFVASYMEGYGEDLKEVDGSLALVPQEG